jgi:hypothetical protein
MFETDVGRLLGEHGIQRDEAARREQFERWMERPRSEETDGADSRAIRRGWRLGPAEFKASLLERMEGKLGEHHSGQLRRESAEAKAGRIIREDLKRLGWSKGERRQRPKSDPAKLAMAARLRRETTLALPWIAARLHMGTWKSLNAKLYRCRKANETPKL